MINQGVTAVLAERDTTRNGDDSHTSGTCVRRNERAVRECTYQDFLKCQLLSSGAKEGSAKTCPLRKAAHPVEETRIRGNGIAVARADASGSCRAKPDNNVVSEMGTYDVIIGMDWLTKYQAIIDCAKKIIRIPFGSEILIFHGDGSRNKRGTRLNIISCTKAQKYLLQGCHVFLAHITIKETGDKSKKKQLQDVPIVKNFPKVFPEDLPGLPPTRQVEFHIDLVPGACTVSTRAPYRLAPSEIERIGGSPPKSFPTKAL
ncbi:putative reverse transcriptase domain-containing protein [Tanacetum coccineum]